MLNSKMMNVRFISIINQMVILEKQNIYIEKRIIRVQVIRYQNLKEMLISIYTKRNILNK